jgi:hypothetical protein
MTVTVLGWNNESAVALVDGVRVRVRRRRSVVWICDVHGRGGPGQCRHTQALADTPIPNYHKDIRP